MKKFVKLLALVCCLVLGVALTLTGCGGAEPQSTTFTLTLDYSKALFADVDRWNFGPKSDNHIVSNTFDEEALATTFSFGKNTTYTEQVYLSLPLEKDWVYTWEFSYESSHNLSGNNEISAQIYGQALSAEGSDGLVAEKKVTPNDTKQSGTLSYTCTESKDYFVVIQFNIAEQSQDLTLTVSNLKLLAKRTFSKSGGNYGGLPTPKYVYLRETEREYTDYFADGYANMQFDGWKLGEDTISNGSELTNKSDHTLVATWSDTIKRQESEQPISGCIVFGTKVMLADGSYKNIEDISFFDRIYRFNHDTGKIDTGYCHWLNKHSTTNGEQEVVYVKFADGGELTFVPPHSMFTRNLNTETGEYSYQYSAVTDTDNFHVGSEIVKMNYNNGSPSWSWTAVTEIKISHDIVQYCQPIMGQMWNFFASDYLTNEADALGFHNMYGFDENLVYANPLRQKVLTEDYLRDDDGNPVYGAGLNKDGTENAADKTFTLLCSNIFGIDLSNFGIDAIPVHLYSEETMKTYFDMLPRDMIGYRGAEWQILVEWCSFLYENGLTETAEFTREMVRDMIIRDTVNSEKHKQETVKNADGKSLWVVTTDNDAFQNFTVPKTAEDIAKFEEKSNVYADYDTYTIPTYTGSNAENFSYWYCSADSKIYHPGDTFEVRYSTHFTAVFK